MTAAVPLVERLAEALGRERDPGEHSPLCHDAEPCRYCTKLARALLPVVEQAVAEAEQRGREDNADHGMCYVHGSRALEARLAEARGEALDALIERADSGIEFGPENFRRLARMVAEVRRADAIATTEEAE